MTQLPQPGQVLGGYVLEEVVASGSQGVVHRGRHSTLGTPVAIKFLSAPDPVTLARFQREAQVLATLRHPHLVRVVDLGQSEQGLSYLVMDFVAGPTLRDRVRSGGPLDPEHAIDLLAPIGDALAHCHSLGILHRDVKPENIVLAERGALLVDFGLVRRDPARGLPGGEDAAERLTQTGEILGTPSYMAPEQGDGARASVGPASDVYGLAATLYFALTGEPPFAGGSLFATLNLLFNQPPPDPRQLVPVPAPLAELCLAGLAKLPAERPSTTDFAKRLRESVPPSSSRRLPFLFLLLLGLLGAGALAASLMTSETSPAPSQTSPTRPPPSPKAALSPSAPRPLSSPQLQEKLPPLPTHWTKVASEGGRFTPRRQPSALGWQGRLWVFPEVGDKSALQPSLKTSADGGRTWQPCGTSGIQLAPQRAASLVHKGRLFLLGGFFSTGPPWPLRIFSVEGQRLRLRATGQAPPPYSSDIQALSLRDRVWILGAASVDGPKDLPLHKRYPGKVFRSDSAHPLTFTEQAAPPWGARYGHRVLVFKERVYLLGGRTYRPEGTHELTNEVWVSENPTLGWRLLKPSAPFPPREHFAACVWRGRIWLGGGLSSKEPIFKLWHSSDGQRWEVLELKSPTGPTMRSSSSLVPLGDESLFLVGGQLPGSGGWRTMKTTNQVWKLR